MATQGLLIITRNHNTHIKAVCGCNGFKLLELARLVEAQNANTVEHVRRLAEEVSFGCNECLVVCDKAMSEEIGGLYKSQFDNVAFNPRWRHGTSDYLKIVEVT